MELFLRLKQPMMMRPILNKITNFLLVEKMEFKAKHVMCCFPRRESANRDKNDVYKASCLTAQIKSSRYNLTVYIRLCELVVRCRAANAEDPGLLLGCVRIFQSQILRAGYDDGCHEHKISTRALSKTVCLSPLVRAYVIQIL